MGIPSPPDKFVLVSSDLIFCLMQFDYCAGLNNSSKSKTDGSAIPEELAPHLHPINFHSVPTPHTSSGAASNTVPHHHHHHHHNPNTTTPSPNNVQQRHWGRNSSKPFLTPDPSPQIYSEPTAGSAAGPAVNESDMNKTASHTSLSDSGYPSNQERRRRTANSKGHDVVVAWIKCLIFRSILRCLKVTQRLLLRSVHPTRWKRSREETLTTQKKDIEAVHTPYARDACFKVSLNRCNAWNIDVARQVWTTNKKGAIRCVCGWWI